MSQGLLIGGSVSLRPPYGTTVLPIASGASLSGVTVAGGFFRVGTLGDFILEVSMRIAANNADTPCVIQLFNVTSGLVVASQTILATPSGVGGDYSVNLPFTVGSITDDYALRIVVNYASDSAGVTVVASPTFTAVVFQAGSGSGTYKAPVRVVSIVNEVIALLAAGSVIDTVPLAAGDRVLLAGQAVAADNGIYDIGAVAGTTVRSADFDTSAEVTSGVLIPVTEGSPGFDNTVWILATNNPIVLGVTALTFVQFGIATAWNAITSPVANQTLTMAAFTTTWNWSLVHVAGNVNELTMNIADATAGTAGYTAHRINKTGAGTGSGPRRFSSYEVAGVPCFAVSVPASMTGVRNTLAGVDAGVGLTSGADNTLYGDSAAVGSADSFATVVGSSALADAKGVALGYNAEATAFSAGESAIAIGYNAFAVRGVVAIGEEAGNVAAYTTCVGAFAGAALTVSFGDEYGTVCVGYKAGTAITTGTGNLMIGYFAGAALTTQKNNVFIGREAGLGTLPFIADTENVLIGYRAGFGIGSGFRNVHIGFESGKFCTGIHNVSVGVSTQSGAAATGSDNTAIGSFSLNNCAGSQNTAVGRATGEAFTMSGADNALLGWRAGRVLTSGASNTCVGSGAGISLTTGANNTLLGKSADGPAASSGMVALGSGATCTASNQFVVGSTTAFISDEYIGNGVTNAAPQSFKVHATGGSGVDIAGASYTMAGGQGTGTGAGGNVVVQVAPSAGTGAALNALSTVLTINQYGQYALTGLANTNNLTASAESIDFNANFARTLTFETGAIATQRSFVVQAPTYAFAAASTITTAATLAVSGAPTAGANATLTNSYAFWAQTGVSKFAGLGLGITTKVFGDSPYTVLASDCTILADATAGAITVNLPAAANNTGRVITVKKIDSSANEVTIDPNGAETLDGATTQSIGVQYTAYTMQCDGSNWFLI